MCPIAQQIITDINEGKCIKKMGLRCFVGRNGGIEGIFLYVPQKNRKKIYRCD